jgi:predicted cobalt transporter CbtA
MRERWLPASLLAVGLFAINVVGRVIAKVWGDGDDDREIRIGLIALGAIGLVVFIAAVRWVSRYPMPRVWADLLFAAGAACAASVLLGPLLVGEQPVAEGAGLFFRQIWWYAGVTLVSGFLGGLIVMTLGKDWKSQAWKRYADRVSARPRKAVRR